MTVRNIKAQLARLISTTGLLTLFLLATISGRAQNSADIFNAANKLYEQQKFSAAAAEYEKLVQSSNVSSAVFFNLGNAYFKSGQLGRAIASYRKAQQIAPRDPNIAANLSFARNEANIKVIEPVWYQWIHRFTLNEWTVATTICFWFFFALLIAGQWRASLKKSFRLWSTLLGVVTVFLGICLTFAAVDRFTTRPAVVAVQEAVVRRGPFDESQSYFTLRDGAEVTVVDTKDKWVQIADASRRTGWLPESQVVVLNGGE